MFFHSRTLAVLLLALAVIGAGTAFSQPKVGDSAPDFTLPAATRDSILSAGLRLSDSFGKGPIVLAFYPADWSGGCTKEMCTMRDNFAGLASLNAIVYGISGDYVFSHREWAKQLGLPFALLSDHDHAVAKTYASFNPDRGFNRRTIFVIDMNGRISYVDLDYKVNSPESFERLSAALKSAR
jgi:glutaredoxin-dependent peroxiredoxin